MSLNEPKIAAFIQLIQEKPSLFSPQDRASLWQLASTLPNDTEQISSAIAEWCQSRESIRNELLPLIAQSQEIDPLRNPSKSFKSADPKDYNYILLNAMRVSFSPPEQQQPSPQQPPQPQPPNSQP
jgi:hypothetical protein